MLYAFESGLVSAWCPVRRRVNKITLNADLEWPLCSSSYSLVDRSDYTIMAFDTTWKVAAEVPKQHVAYFWALTELQLSSTEDTMCSLNAVWC
jgi:hypothetical protein